MKIRKYTIRKKRIRNYTLSPTERQIQIAIIEWCDLKRIPMVHIANEGKRSVREGALLKKQGMRPGFPDLFCPLPNTYFHGLFIEVKTLTGKPTQNQVEWIDFLQKKGYCANIVYGYDNIIKCITAYIKDLSRHD